MTAEDDEVKERLERRFAEALASRNGESYHDANGNPTTLEKLCRTEPEWAVSRIRDLRSKVYIGEHEFPDLTWEARCEEAASDLARLRAVLRHRGCDTSIAGCKAFCPGCPEKKGSSCALAQSPDPKPGTLAYVFKDDPAPTPEEHARFLEALGDGKDEKP